MTQDTNSPHRSETNGIAETWPTGSLCDGMLLLLFWSPILGSAVWKLQKKKKKRASKISSWKISTWNVWKPAHLWLAPCSSGQTLTLDSSTRWPWRSRDAGVRASTQKETLRASMRALYVSGLRAPKAFKKWRSALQAASCWEK